MIQVHGGGGFPALGKYNYPRPAKPYFFQVEIPRILRPPQFKPFGVRQPLVEGRILWRAVALNRL